MRVLVADDHEMLRDTLRAYLEAEGGFVVDTAPDLPAALARVGEEPPLDLVLLDYNMPGMNGYAGLKQVIDASAGCPVAMMSGVEPPNVRTNVLAAGGAGYLPKALPVRSVINAMRFMAAGETFMPANDAMMQPSPGPCETDLSVRERQVLGQLCHGKSNKDIARVLGLREPTIKLYMKQICRKLGARNRTEAVIIARDRKLL
jgi:two-component system, NarL family, nitrate/nitrite response regulator NarL